MKPAEFLALTPAELNKMAEGYKRRQRLADERAAYWVSCLVNCHVTKPVTSEALLEPLYKEKDTPETFRRKESKFMSQFKEVLNNGNNSQSGRENRRGHK